MILSKYKSNFCCCFNYSLMIFLEKVIFFGLGGCPETSDLSELEPRRPTYPLRIAAVNFTSLDS